MVSRFLFSESLPACALPNAQARGAGKWRQLVPEAHLRASFEDPSSLAKEAAKRFKCSPTHLRNVQYSTAQLMEGQGLIWVKSQSRSRKDEGGLGWFGAQVLNESPEIGQFIKMNLDEGCMMPLA